MGEFADMAIDEALNAWEYEELHPEEFHWTELDGGFFGKGLRSRRRRGKTCNICGQKGLRWDIDEDTDNWVLENTDGTRHVCKMKRKLNEFQRVP
jgi:hypothetical protein